MTDEQIDALALRFAGLLTTGDGMRAFARAVAAAERERCAALLGDVLAERERCAKLCDEIGATMTAQAIREGA